MIENLGKEREKWKPSLSSHSIDNRQIVFFSWHGSYAQSVEVIIQVKWGGYIKEIEHYPNNFIVVNYGGQKTCASQRLRNKR